MMMAYAAWSVVFGEQPSAAKWNILGTNDASFNDGTGLNTGSVQQIVSTGFSAVATGTTTIPVDDTIPQNTEGTQFMTQAITPKSATNLLVIEIKSFVSLNSATSRSIGALFQDSTASALAVAEVYNSISSGTYEHVIQYTMTAGTISATTFKYRAGPESAVTMTFNGIGGSRFYGTSQKSSIIVTEYKA